MNIINEIKDELIESGIKESEAIKALRLFCRRFGGQVLYFPNKLLGSKTEDIFNLLKIEMSEIIAEKIVRLIVENFGGIAEYVPQERTAFKNEIMFEIYSLYQTAINEKKKNKVDDICVTYGMSYVQVHKLVKKYKSKKQNTSKLKSNNSNKEKNKKGRVRNIDSTPDLF